MAEKVPFLVFTQGPFRSASTWVANVVVELLSLRAPTRLVFADKADDLARNICDSHQIVVKSHIIDDSMSLLMRLSSAKIVLSVREPLDCVVSYMQTFGETFDSVADLVRNSAENTLSILNKCDALVVVFEGDDARGVDTIRRIADHIGVEAALSEAQDIADRLSAASVKSFIDDLIATGHFGSDPNPNQIHAETHWHPGHVGPGLSGRYMDALSVDQIEQVVEMTRPFRERFGYSNPYLDQALSNALEVRRESDARVQRIAQAELEISDLTSRLQAVSAELEASRAMAAADKDANEQQLAHARAELSDLRDRSNDKAAEAHGEALRAAEEALRAAEIERGHLEIRAAQAEADLRALQPRLAAVAAERDESVGRLDAARADLDLAFAERAAEADAHRRALGAAEDEKGDLARRLAETKAAREDLQARLSGVSADLDAHRDALGAVTAEREAFADRVVQADSDLQDAKARLVALTAERDAVLADVAAARADADALGTALDQARLERDATLYRRLRKRLGGET